MTNIEFFFAVAVLCLVIGLAHGIFEPKNTTRKFFVAGWASVFTGVLFTVVEWLK